MKLKERLRQKVKRLLGISDIENQLTRFARPDLVRQLEIRAQSSSAEYLEQNMTKAKALETTEGVIDFALDRVLKNKAGLYCEFGVFQGKTINHIARKIGTTKVYGFDSFEGLPEFWRDGFPAGAFDLGKGVLPKCETNVELIVGWFDKSLPSFVSAHPEPLLFLHVDCDLYSSTQTIFNTIGKQLVSGSVIVFDEYFNYPAGNSMSIGHSLNLLHSPATNLNTFATTDTTNRSPFSSYEA